MEKQALRDFITHNIPNIAVTQNGLDIISEHFDETLYDKNEFLLKQGRISDYYYLAEGVVRAYTFDTDGNEITTAFYSAGQVIFEAASFFLRQPSQENMQAMTPCITFTTSFDKLNKLFHEVPEFREFGRAILVKEFVAYKQRTLGLINKSAEQRYAELIEKNSGIFQHVQLKHIASYLGVTDTSLSRIRKEYAHR